MRDFDYFAVDAKVADWKEVTAAEDMPEAVRGQLRLFRRKAAWRFSLAGLCCLLALIAAGMLAASSRVSRTFLAVIVVALVTASAQMGWWAWRFWRQGPFHIS